MPNGFQTSQTGQRRSLFQLAQRHPVVAATTVGLATTATVFAWSTGRINFGNVARRYSNIRETYRGMQLRRVVMDATSRNPQQYAPREGIISTVTVEHVELPSFPSQADTDLLTQLRRRGIDTDQATVDIVHLGAHDDEYINGMAAGFHWPGITTRLHIALPPAHLVGEQRAVIPFLIHHELTHVLRNHLTVDALVSGATHGAVVLAALTAAPNLLTGLGVYAGGLLVRGIVQGAVSRTLERQADREALPYLNEEELVAARDLHLAPTPESSRPRVPSYGEIMYPGFYRNPLLRRFGLWYQEQTREHPTGEERAERIQEELDRREAQRSNP